MDLNGIVDTNEDVDDIILKVEDAEIKCSKRELMSKSEYFQAMFKFKEKRDILIELHSVEANAVKILVDWVHTDNIECVNNMEEQALFDLLQASNMLQFLVVQEACVSRLTAMLNFKNCFRIKKQAEFLSEKKLYNAANAFCLWNFNKVASSEVFVKLEFVEVKEYLMDLQINVEREACIVEAIFTWTSWPVRCGLADDRADYLWSLIVETVIFPSLSISECRSFLNNDLVQNCKNVKGLLECIIFLKEGVDTILNEDEVDSGHKGFEDNTTILEAARQLLETAKMRQLPRQPCVIGHRLEQGPSPVSCSRHSEQRVACVFMYNRRTGEVEELVDMVKRARVGWKPDHDGEGPVEASGYKAIDLDGGFIVMGGEFALGRSNWNSSVLKYCGIKGDWSSLAPLEHPRRHHSLVRIGTKIYLLGGFGKHRIVLDTVEVLDTVTGEITECDNLPVSLYRPAATHFDGRIYVFGKVMVCYLEPGVSDTWENIKNVELPRHIEFSTAMSSKTHIYLTSSHSHELYRFNPSQSEVDSVFFDNEEKCCLELIGKFSKETHNTTIIDNVIYNFSTEEFDDERVVECFDIEQSKFSILWKKDCPRMDFSPSYCLGCFPIVSYK